MHDFKKYPELRNSQMDIYYFQSPHKQIFEDFEARVIKVTDGDTVRVTCDFRDFNFPIRLAYINAAEMSEGGARSKKWLEDKIMGEEVQVLINPKNRVGKWGRLIGQIIHNGMNMSELSILENQSLQFGTGTSDIPDFSKELEVTI